MSPRIDWNKLIWKVETHCELQAFVSFQVYPEERNEERTEEERQKEIYWIQFWLSLVGYLVYKSMLGYSNIQYKSCFMLFCFLLIWWFKDLFFIWHFAKVCAVLQHICASFVKENIWCKSNNRKNRRFCDRSTNLLENCISPLKCACSSNEFYNPMEVTAAILATKRDQSEEPVGPTLTNHHPAWNALPVTPSSPLHLSFLSPPKTHQNPP